MNGAELILTRLSAQLSRDSGWDVRPGIGGLFVHGWPGGSFTPPLPIRITAADVDALVENVDNETADALWPGRPADFVAFALLSIQLEEILGTQARSGGEIRLRDKRLEYEEPGKEEDPTPSVRGPGWYAVAPRSGERFVQALAAVGEGEPDAEAWPDRRQFLVSDSEPLSAP